MQIEKEIEKIKVSTIKYKVHDPEKYKFLMTMIEDELGKRSNDEPYMSDIFNDQLLKVEEKKNSNHEWLIKEMSKSRFKVYCTTESKPFLTSDNPGYSVHEGDKIGNLFLGSAKSFAFPISKTRLFVITPDDRDGNELIIKKIKYIEMPEEFIRLSNKATIINAEERIFSNSKKYLDDLIDVYDFEINKYKNEYET